MNQNQHHLPELIPYRKGDYFGYADKDKNIVVEPVYDQAFPFSGHIARIFKGGKYGLINIEGDEIIPPECEEIGSYDGSFLNSDGSCTIIKNGKFGLLSCQGNVLAGANYNSEEEAFEFAIQNGWNGAVPKERAPGMPEEVVSSIERLEQFQNGVARFRKNNLWGLMTEKGEEIVPPKYDRIAPLEDDSWPVVLDDRWGLVAKTGNEIISPQYEEARGFSEGLAVCKQNGLFGAIDEKEEWVILPKYSELGQFKSGLFAAQSNGAFGFIDRNDKTVIEFQFPDVLDFDEGVCGVLDHDMIYFIDKSGQKISENFTRLYGPNEEGLIHVIKANKWGIIKSNGAALLPIEYDLPKAMGQDIQSISEGMIPMKKGALLGFLDNKGEEIVPPKYVTVDAFSNGLSRVAILDEKMNPGISPETMEMTGSISGLFLFGYVNKEGEEVITPKYRNAYPFFNGIAQVETVDLQVKFISIDGTEYVE